MVLGDRGNMVFHFRFDQADLEVAAVDTVLVQVQDGQRLAPSDTAC
jgi:hypothetical protein